MRKIGNFSDKKLQSEQFNVLVKLLSDTREFRSVKAVLTSILTESERAAISQRLAIIRMSCKSFNYSQIQEKLKTTPNTVSKAIINYQKNYDYITEFDHVLARFRFDPSKFSEPVKIAYPHRGNMVHEGLGARGMIRQTLKEHKRKTK